MPYNRPPSLAENIYFKHIFHLKFQNIDSSDSINVPYILYILRSLNPNGTTYPSHFSLISERVLSNL